MKKTGLLLVFFAFLSFAQNAPTELTQVPPRPTCGVPLYNGSNCYVLWQQYNLAVQQRTQENLQIYVQRQKELASAQAAAPLQQQIADLTKLTTDQQNQIKSLHDQMQADAASALEAKADAHTAGLQRGAGMGAGGILLLVGIIFGIKKMTTGYTVTKKEQAKAASA